MGVPKIVYNIQEMARLLREEMANWQRWDLTDDWKTASRLRVRLPPRQTITTVCLHRHHHYPFFHEVGLKMKKVDKGCKRKIWWEIMVAQNETSPPDCIPVIQVWWWWYVLGFDCILACRLDHILAYLALIAYWSCKWWWQGHDLGQMISTGHWPALLWPPVSDTLLVALRRGMTSLGQDGKRMNYRPGQEFLSISLISSSILWTPTGVLYIIFVSLLMVGIEGQ